MNEFDTSFQVDATLIAEMIVFGIVLVLMSKVILPPFRKAMAERQAQIERSIAATAEAEERLAAADAEYERHVDDAHRQARKILGVYEDIGRQVLSEARERAGAARPSGGDYGADPLKVKVHDSGGE